MVATLKPGTAAANHRARSKARYYAMPEHYADYNRAFRRAHAWLVEVQAYEYKGGARCVDCGYSANLNGLEFDHVPERGPKMFTVGGMISLGRWTQALQDELDKCDVVCAICHNIRTAARRAT